MHSCAQLRIHRLHLVEIKLSLCSNVLQGNPSSQGGAGEAGSQSDVEELNVRLFELRVELQNLADDTAISVASITRKVCQCTVMCASL